MHEYFVFVLGNKLQASKGEHQLRWHLKQKGNYLWLIDKN